MRIYLVIQHRELMPQPFAIGLLQRLWDGHSRSHRCTDECNRIDLLRVKPKFADFNFLITSLPHL
jgi:hypothetical protein